MPRLYINVKIYNKAELIRFYACVYLLQITLTGSCYTTIAITIERFLAIRLPFFIQKHNVKARVFIIPIVMYCFLYNLPRFFEYEIIYLGCHDFKNGSYSNLEYDTINNITCDNAYILNYSQMRQSPTYVSVSKFCQILCPHPESIYVPQFAPGVFNLETAIFGS